MGCYRTRKGGGVGSWLNLPNSVLNFHCVRAVENYEWKLCGHKKREASSNELASRF
jgi:hypothetical protein